MSNLLFAATPAVNGNLLFGAVLGGNQATGFTTSLFGTPIGLAPLPHIIALPTGFVSTTFGTPYAINDQKRIAIGYLATRFGTPTKLSPRTVLVSGAASLTAFGTPVLVTPSVSEAVSFLATRFGTPSFAWYAQGLASTVAFGEASGLQAFPTIFPATGFAVTAFGVPVGYYSRFASASGFVGTQFGASRVLLDGGLLLTKFGTPLGYERFPATSLGVTTRWAEPYVAYSPVTQVVSINGFFTTSFGQPIKAYAATVSYNAIGSSSGEVVTTFGTTTYTTVVTETASGATSTVFGQPRSRVGFAVQSVEQQVLFGQANVLGVAKANGFVAANFATPSMMHGLPAQGFYRSTRWGVARIKQSDTYPAGSLRVGNRFGVPKGLSINNYPATSLHSTQFGTHDMRSGYRASMIAPVAKFSKPLMKRNVTC